MRIRLRDLAGHLATTAFTVGEDGAPHDPITVVDLDDRTVEDGLIEALQHSSRRVLVGISSDPPPPTMQPLLEALDLTLVPHRDGLDRCLVGVTDAVAGSNALETAVADNPRAALALVTLLRLTERLPVPEGLAAESAVYSMLLAGPEFARWRATRAVRPLPDYDRSPVRISRDGGRLEVVLDHPRRRNAFSRQMRDGLVEAFDLALADATITEVCLRGNGPAFCSGGDLDEFGTAVDVSLAHLVRIDRSVAARIDRCRDRVVVHLHGACVGAGIELPSFADTISAHPDARLHLPELQMGLVPGAGGTVGITRRIGRWRTAYLALCGEPIDVATAVDWGLVDQVLVGSG